MPEMTAATVLLAGRSIPYTLRHSERARRLRISVSAQGLTVTLPKGLTRRNAEAFLQENAAWVLQQLQRAEHTKKKTVTLPPDVILLAGKPVHIRIIQETDRVSRVKVEEHGDRLTVRVPSSTREKPRSLVLPWLKARARTELEAAVKRQAARLNLNPKSITIRDQRTRWGSCSARGTLSFSWRLVMAPPEVLEYVVIHELAHLVHPNHSRDFWAYVAKACPRYKNARLWMKKNASALRPPDL